MSTGTNDWIEIARTGRFRDAAGVAVEIGQPHLERLAATDLTAGVPLVFGHPRVEDPAYGWVDELRVQGDRLLAKLRDVPEAVRSLVRAGHYRHVSIRATPDLGRLRHVGLLGAVPPAIEGLKPVELAAPDGSVDLVFAQQQHMEEQMDELTKALNELAATKAALAEREARLQAVEGELQTLQKDFASHRDETVRKNREARVQRLVESGRIMPGAKDETLAFATALAQGDTTLNFASEGPLPAEEAFFRRLEARDDNGLFVEFATLGAAGAGEEPTAARDAAPAALAGKF